MPKDKKSKRDLILDAAFTIFISKGYLETKIIDIAEAAGIGKGTVYEYFESKDAIFYELFQTKVAAGYDSLSELPGKDISCEKKLEEYVGIELANTSKYNFSKNFIMDLMLKTDVFHNAALIESIHELLAKKMSIMHSILEEGINTGEFRKMDPLLASVSVMGALNFYISIDYCPFELNELLPVKKKNWHQNELLELILHGLKP